MHEIGPLNLIGLETRASLVRPGLEDAPGNTNSTLLGCRRIAAFLEACIRDRCLGLNLVLFEHERAWNALCSSGR